LGDPGVASRHDPLRLSRRRLYPGGRPAGGAGPDRRPRRGRRHGAGGVPAMRPPPFRPPSMRRVVIIVPSLFTLFNLFFGIWSMVHASRGEFYPASWFIVFAGILDSLDGRVARLSNTGTRFGAELDSLVDIVSFGVAPAFLLSVLNFAAMSTVACGV